MRKNESGLGGLEMTFLELARLTLEKAKGPSTVDEIWTRGIEYGYAQQVRTTGKTPSRTSVLSYM